MTYEDAEVTWPEAIQNHWHLMGLSWAVVPEVSHISALAEECLERTESSKIFINSKHRKQELQLSETRAARKTPGRRLLTLQLGWASLAQQSLHTVPQISPQCIHPTPPVTSFSTLNSALPLLCAAMAFLPKKETIVWSGKSKIQRRDTGKQRKKSTGEHTKKLKTLSSFHLPMNITVADGNGRALLPPSPSIFPSPLWLSFPVPAGLSSHLICSLQVYVSSHAEDYRWWCL